MSSQITKSLHPIAVNVVKNTMNTVAVAVDQSRMNEPVSESDIEAVLTTIQQLIEIGKSPVIVLVASHSNLE